MKKLIGIFLIFLACSGSKEEEKYTESAEIHDEAISIAEVVEGKIKELEKRFENENVSGAPVDTLKELKEDFTEWKGNVVEVPGHEHDHSDHHHHHHHNESENLTPELMLVVQKELKKQIIQLDKRAQKLTEKIEKKTYDQADKE